MSISSDLRKAAMGPTPKHSCWAGSWAGNLTGAHFFVLAMDSHRPGPSLADITNAERRMFLLFCAHAAEDEGK